jgi:hypothetical protein
MYGCYGIELAPTSKTHSHSQDSLRMCGPPVARIIRNSPMKGLIGFSKCEILQFRRIS